MAVVSGKNIPIGIAKEECLKLLAAGRTVAQATAAVGRAATTHDQWMFKDPAYKAEVERIRAARAAAKERGAEASAKYAMMSFAEFRKEFLGVDTYRHQQAWVDVIEGKDYTPVPGETWEPGKNRKRILINTPPSHAKTTTITIDYVTYRICLNPNIRVIVVSKTQAMAKKFLYAIKKRLTDRQFAHLQAVFAPEGGFKGTGEWSQNRIYVGHADSGEKDPTVEALGIGGQIYGVRADLIILDDVADVGNAHEFEKQITWLTQDVESRIKGGTVIVVGTRVGVQDIYSELMNGERYLSGTSPWTRLAQPAVLRYADDPADWVTLWPYSSTPHDQFESGDEQDGQYVMWDGPALSLVRESKSAKIWALVYQQQSYSAEDQTFRPTCVWGSVDRRRKPGPLTAGGWGHPRDGGQGMYTIAAMDPAMTGDTFTVVGKVDRSTQQRWIENAFVQPSPSTQYFRDVIKRVTVEYGVNEWVIEKNAFQLYLIRDPEITNFLASRGVKLTPHYSGNNKSDPDFGVASVAPLFGSTRRINEGSGREVFNKDNLIELPDPDYSQGIKTLVEELLTWVPGKRGKDLRQDGPMALWFFELRARQVLGFGRDNKPPQQHMPIPFLSRGRAARRAVTPPPLRGLRPQFEEVNVA